MNYYIGKSYHFSAGHWLWDGDLSSEENREIFGNCVNKHGHNYEVIVEIGGDLHDGMVMNYYKLNEIMKPIIDYFDHCPGGLNSLEEFELEQTTAENLAYVIYDKVFDALGTFDYGNIWVESVTVKETPKTFARVR